MAFSVYIPKVGSTEDKELTFIAILLILIFYDVIHSMFTSDDKMLIFAL